MSATHDPPSTRPLDRPAGGPEQAAAPVAAPLPRPALAAELVEEIDRGAFSYPWPLAAGVSAPVDDPTVRHAAWTLETMLEEPARSALAASAGGRRALVLGAAEGRLAHRLLEWGARRVVAVEPSPRARRRGELIRDHFGIDPSALELRAPSELTALEPAWREEGADVVVVDLAHHGAIADPAFAAALALARGLWAIAGEGRELGEAAAAARAVGLAPAPAPLPLEAERRYVAREWAVLIAAPGAGR